MVTRQMPNDADLCDLFGDWVAGIKTRNEILVTNPARLYGFSR
jgi:predicted TIM-barrel fold metal-dependent hydrolase